MTDKRDDGGPAFPWGEHRTHLGGMSLRDWFAGQALAGLLAHGGLIAGDDLLERLAKDAGNIADAMLVERRKP